MPPGAGSDLVRLVVLFVLCLLFTAGLWAVLR